MTKRISLLWVFLTIAHAPVRAQSILENYPPARRGNVVDTYHGETIQDPYRWMEEMESAETKAWVTEQENLLERFLGDVDERDALKERIETLQQAELYSTPVKAGAYYVFTRASSVSNRPVLYAQIGLDGAPRVVFAPEGEDILTGFTVSPAGRYVAVYTSEGPSRWRRVRILTMPNGDVAPDELTGIHTLSGSVSWLADERGFFYTRYELPPDGEQLTAPVERPRLFYHEIGTRQSEDGVVFERPEHPQTLLQHAVSADGTVLAVTIREGSDPNTVVATAEIGADPTRAAPRRIDMPSARYAFLGSDDTTMWMYTTLEAPRGRIIAVELQGSESRAWREVVPERRETVAGGSLVGGNAVSLLGDRFVAMVLRDAQPLVRVFSLLGDLEGEIELPGVGSIWGGFTGDRHENEVFYAFLSLTAGRTVYRLDLDTGESSVFKRSRLAFDADAFESRQVFVTSTDGTRVPMFVTYRKGIELDGSHYAFMYGYGAFGWIAFPWYQAHVVAWLERGGVYALPAIRGGGEYGEEWHRAGIGVNRQNAIDDYIAAAEWLVEHGYTSPQKLVANGGSASGALAAAALMQRPDLFGAGVIDIPALDLLRYHRFTAAGSWIEEFGSADDPADFEVLRSISPYHNVAPGACYPPILTMVGERDETAVPMHGYKFTAALQHAQTCDSPALLKVIRGAGHSHGTTSEQQARTWADALAFIIKSLDLASP